MNNNKICFILYPYPVRSFIMDTHEYNYLSKYIKIIYFDLSHILFPNIYNRKNYINHTNVIKINNLFHLLKVLFYLINKNKKNEIFIINEITPTNKTFREYCVSFFFKIILNNQKSILRFQNPGIFLKSNLKKNYKFIKILKSTFRKFQLFFDLKTTHILMAGKIWEKNTKIFYGNYPIKYIYGNSNDYSRAIINDIEDHKFDFFLYNVLLDTPGPLFTGDSSHINNKDHFTIEKWYPAITNFFNNLELYFKTPTIIAGHYKSKHDAISPYFGNRNVFYGKTALLVKNSTLVTTIHSTAISYAIFYKKPILLIFSDEQIDHIELMENINTLSEMLNLKKININDLKTLKESNLFTINLELYRQFELNFLTSLEYKLPNYLILLKEFFNINIKTSNFN